MREDKKRKEGGKEDGSKGKWECRTEESMEGVRERR